MTMAGPNPPCTATAAEDAVVVNRVLSGDREAYAILVRRYQSGLYRHARCMGMDHDTALDHVQDAFVRAYTSLAECRDRDRFRTWLFRILRNRCLDHLKNIRRRHVSVDSVTLAQEAGSAATEARAALRDAFRSLSPVLREAFLLKHRDGCSYEEIAERTGASVSALKMRVHRARDLLRAHLEGAGVDRPM
jgi:RNA polymerase sigma-70 factor (ECF subfamily)